MNETLALMLRQTVAPCRYLLGMFCKLNRNGTCWCRYAVKMVGLNPS
jgi:hypothetical protein